MRAQKTGISRAGMWALWLTILAFAMITACQSNSKGFVLPEGDTELGAKVFTELNCDRCHSIGDIKWSGSEAYDDPYVKLGGEVSQIKTYGELVTSVINPSHKISEKSLSDGSITLGEGMSKMEMYRYNQIMTVDELVNVVAYLQAHYELVRPDNPYPKYGF